MTMSPMAEHLDLLIAERRLRTRTATLARQIDADYRDRPLSLVVVLKGAAIFAADLTRRITIPLTLDFISAASYGAGTESSGKVALGGTAALPIAGRHVLVIEDIIDSGCTAAAIFADLQERQPASLALCTLLRKPSAPPAGTPPLPIAYVGFDIANDFVVGWGMDYAERYRNLRGIYRLSFRQFAG